MSERFLEIFWGGVEKACAYFGSVLIVVGSKEFWGNGADLVAAGVLLFLWFRTPIEVNVFHQGDGDDESHDDQEPEPTTEVTAEWPKPKWL
jgi:hypothetical protein